MSIDSLPAELIEAIESHLDYSEREGGRIIITGIGEPPIYEQALEARLESQYQLFGRENQFAAQMIRQKIKALKADWDSYNRATRVNWVNSWKEGLPDKVSFMC